MKNSILSFYRALFLVCCFTAAATASAVEVSNPEPSCVFDGVTFESDFPMGRISDCRYSGKRYVLDIRPENIPVNPSSWYAFKVTSKKKANIKVYLDYGSKKHRYYPKISTDGKSWTPLGKRDYKRAKDKKGLTIKLKVGPEPIWVAGQEIITSADHNAWADRMARLPFVEKSLLGKSTEGRPIYKLETNSAQKNPGYVVFVGRQHPPELTGAMALTPFVETLYRNTPLAKKFREKFNVIVVPNLNPDGVEHGHWRHNVKGVDLNRDWGPFKQVETQLMRDELARFLKGDPKLYFFADFHSTWKDVLYTQPDHQETFPKDFAKNWVGAIRDRLPKFKLDRGGSSNFNKPTSKGYVYRTFGTAAMTYEMSDKVDRKVLAVVANVAAEEMMKLLLEAYQE